MGLGVLLVELSNANPPLRKISQVKLQAVPRAGVYYVRGGFRSETCTGCFSGPGRVNSSSCALPAGGGRGAFIHMCVSGISVGVYLHLCVLVCVEEEGERQAG